MNAIRVVSGKHANSPWRGQSRGRLVAIMVWAVVLCLGISPLAAQTTTNSAGLTRPTTASDSNTAVKDPNALSNGTAAADPNQVAVSDPNQAPVTDPNQVSVSDPNQTPVVDPNKVPDNEPNAGLFNKPGNLLICDQLNHRVIEVDRDTHEIVWQFGDGNSVAGPKSVVAPHDAERVGEWTLICGTGLATSTEPNATTGSPDHRVLLVDRSGKIFWQYGKTGVAGSDANQLNAPTCAAFLPYGHILITDQGNHRVIEVSMVTKQIVWQHGMTGSSGTRRNYLNAPNSAQWLDNGDILIADQGNDRVIEVNRRHRIVWRYGDTDDPNVLSGPAYACRLPNNHTLITDSGNNRILEVNRRGHTVLEFVTNKQPGSVADPLPWRAVRLENGDTLISDQFNHQVIEIDAHSNVVFTQGTIGMAGSGSNQLNSPCDAKAIGDYTGLTPPSLDSYCEGYEDPEPQDQDDDDWGAGPRNRERSRHEGRGRF